jgi:hypothetical protein
MKRLYRRIAVPLVGALALVPVLAGPASAKTAPPIAFTTIGTITAYNAGARTVTLRVQASSLDSAGETVVTTLPTGTNPLVNGKYVSFLSIPMRATAVVIGTRSGSKNTVTWLSAVKH